jgi:hypothetical protein
MEELLRWVYAIELRSTGSAFGISIVLTEIALIVAFVVLMLSTRDKGEK